ncbi:MAG: AI-2E family transporter [Lachnospiraceae bacterium]|nr:AI-2E family transporter [Lachnospiraceae bacterium]
MKKRSIKEAPWFPHAVVACIAVALYVFLTKFDVITEAIGTFIGFFSPVITGCIIAYIVNPLAKFFKRTLFFKIKKESRRDFFANFLAFICVIAFLVFSMMVLIPQLIESVQVFSRNLNDYIASLIKMLDNIGIPALKNQLINFVGSSETILSAVSDYISNNAENIVTASASAGKGVVNWLIAFILSIYIMAEKRRLKAGAIRLMRAVFTRERFKDVCVFLRKCDGILNRYIIYNMIDCFAVGIANAIFMTIAGMEYVGLVSFVVGITNVIPTFGPAIGSVIGALVLLMVKPAHALIFLIFTLVLQTIDGYVLKPRLFGNSLGVSGMWILIGIVVGGNMFGVAGILLAIPAVAIIDFMYGNYILPKLEKKRRESE